MLCPRWDSNPHSNPCKHWELQKTSPIGANPADVRPSPPPKVRTLYTRIFLPDFVCNPGDCRAPLGARGLCFVPTLVPLKIRMHWGLGWIAAEVGYDRRRDDGPSRQTGFDGHHGKFCYVYPISPASMRAGHWPCFGGPDLDALGEGFHLGRVALHDVA